MAYELKDGEGSLWKNEDRKTDSHPHAKGQLKIGGVIYWVDAWTNETPNGKKFQKLKVRPKDDQPARSPQSREPEQELSADDEDLPF